MPRKKIKEPGTSLIPIEIAKDEFTIFVELNELESLVGETEATADKLSSEYVRITTEMQTMFKDLESLNQPYMDEILKLGEELRVLEEEAAERARVSREAEENLSNKTSHARETIEAELDADRESEVNSFDDAKSRLKDLKRHCKKLYFKISNKCHPDKIKRKDLNEFFVLASKAYSKLDVSRLNEIWDLVQTGKSQRKAILESKLRESEERARLCHLQLMSIVGSNEFQTLLQMYRREKDFNIGHNQTKSIFKANCLDGSRQNIINRIRQLDPTRHVPKPQPIHTFGGGTLGSFF